MLPSPDADSPPLKRPKSSDGNLTSLFSLSPCQRVFLIAVVISLQLTLLLSTRSYSSFLRRPPPPPAVSCTTGQVFVYDLPSAFNLDFISNCSSLNPWTSTCSAFSNHGFGPSAASDLAGFIPSSLLSSWFATDQFAAELIFHRRILSHRCRTLNSSAASAFYIPFYAGLAVGKHLWLSSPASGEQRDRDCRLLLDWIKSQPPWLRSHGRDHFLMLGRITWDFRRSIDGDWGSSFLHMPEMENVTRLIIERNPWDQKDVGVPYPTGFHPKSPAQLKLWLDFVINKVDRSTLFSFAGAKRAGIKNDFRGLLLDECARANGTCRSVDCSGGKCGNSSRQTLSLFLESRFCLQPRGDSFTRRSMFDCMVAGAIPVLFWRRSAYNQYEWFLDGSEEWSVFVDRGGVREGRVSLRRMLEGIGEERERRMRERVVEMIPRLVYGGGDQGIGAGTKDAFEVAIDGVLRRFKQQRKG